MANYKKGKFDSEKYIITKTNGKPINPHADYFVLNLAKDPHAQVALVAYAESVREDNEELADDLENKLREEYGYYFKKSLK